jgi:drug/metabolite transporter (DMT)-like permease
MAVAILLATGAAFCSALAVVFQRVALESASSMQGLSPRLMAAAVRKRGWLIGLCLMLGTFALQTSALRFGQLSVVQPVLTTELIFLVLILVIGFRRTVGRREVAGITAIIIGLAAFFRSAAPAAGTGQPSRTAWVVLSVIVVIAAVGLVALGRIGPRWWRAAALAASAATLFAYNAALAKTLTALLRNGGLPRVFESLDPYLIAASGAAGLVVLQGALVAGPITASRTANVVVNPLVSIVIGITAFGERLHLTPASVAFVIASLAILCAGIAVLARSPLVTGAGPAGDEYLAAGPPAEPRPAAAVPPSSSGASSQAPSGRSDP